MHQDNSMDSNSENREIIKVVRMIPSMEIILAQSSSSANSNLSNHTNNNNSSNRSIFSLINMTHCLLNSNHRSNNNKRNTLISLTNHNYLLYSLLRRVSKSPHLEFKDQLLKQHLHHKRQAQKVCHLHLAVISTNSSNRDLLDRRLSQSNASNSLSICKKHISKRSRGFIRQKKQKKRGEETSKRGCKQVFIKITMKITIIIIVMEVLVGYLLRL